MTTHRLEREDAMIRTWATKGRVDKSTVALDESAFFPGGGGQPADGGTVAWPGGSGAVTAVEERAGTVVVTLDTDPPADATDFTCELDWARRHLLMRTHTAFHLLSAVMGERFGSLVTGGNMEPGRGRSDFSGPVTADVARAAIDRVNELAAGGHAVRVEWLPRAEFEANPDLRRLALDLVPDVDPVRIVTIDGVDRQADGGTHVANTSEIGPVAFEAFANKGSRNKRIIFTVGQQPD